MWARRTLTSAARSAAIGAAIVAAFAGGVVVGVGGRSSTPATRAESSPGGAAGTGATRSPAADPVAQARSALADALHPKSAATLDAAAIKAMLVALGDPWASYHPADDDDQATATLDGSYAGLGLWLRSQADGEVLVSSVLPGSSAANGGIAPGEHLISVANRPARGVPLANVVSSLRGTAGTTVTVVSATATGSLRRTTLTRSEVAVDDASVQRLPGGILLARVAALSRGVSKALSGALAKARQAGQVRGIVLDLRGDPGGLLDEGVGVASQFLNGGTVVSYQRRVGAGQVLTATGHGDTTTPLAVLVDGGTASAAEVVAGALQDRHRALLVGSKSFGKGSVQEPLTLSDGSTIEFTVGHYATPSGRSLDGVGLTPDIAVAPPSAGRTANGKPLGATGSTADPALAEAETVVGALLADAGTRTGSGRG